MSKKKSLEDILQSIDQRNPTMNTPVGPIPRPKTPQGVHKQEKKNLKTRGYTGTGYSGSLMGGSSSSTFTNTSAIRRTFEEFMSLAEGKKKDLKRLKSAYMAGQELAPPQIVNYGDSAPNSPERASQIAAMMRNSGGGAVRKAIKKREENAEKAAKNILKQQQEGFSIKKSQKELENKRKKAEQRKRQEAAQRREQLYRERVHGDGMVSYEKDESGVVRRGRRKDGKFTPDADT